MVKGVPEALLKLYEMVPNGPAFLSSASIVPTSLPMEAISEISNLYRDWLNTGPNSFTCVTEMITLACDVSWGTPLSLHSIVRR